MDMLIEECKKRGVNGIDAFVDNIILMSLTFKEHIKDLILVLQVLNEANMSLRISKCEFAFPSTELLGFIVDGKTVKPAPSNTSKILEFPVPTSQ